MVLATVDENLPYYIRIAVLYIGKMQCQEWKTRQIYLNLKSMFSSSSLDFDGICCI